MQSPVRNDGGKALKDLRGDTSGLAMIYVTAMLPVIIGMALLAIDVGRLSTLQSSLQHGADALALAGAAELDSSDSSIARSEAAIAGLVTTNKSLFATLLGSDAAEITTSDITTCYLSALPATDALPLGGCLNKGSGSQDARFVQVVVTPEYYTTIFPVTFLSSTGVNYASTGAEAVAGFDAAVCNFTPIYMCNPLEPPTGTTDTFEDYGLMAHVDSYSERRKIIKFLAVATGSTTTGVPGQFGFLDPASGNGKNALEQEIAATQPGLCFKQNTLKTKTGAMSSLRHAFNIRFDMYHGGLSKGSYPPAANVRKGYIVQKQTGGKARAGNACSKNDNKLAGSVTNNATGLKYTSAQFLGLPTDSCFKTSTCSPANVGNGDWGYEPEIPADVSFTTYWNTNYPGVSIPSPSDLGIGASTTPFTNANPPPRYDIYRYENTHMHNGKLLRANPSAGATTDGVKFEETGLPNCAAPADAVETPDRRIIYGAIVNCLAEDLRSGSNNTYRAVAFGKFFMTRPMPDSSNSELWLELVDLVAPGDNTGVARDIVQLYR